MENRKKPWRAQSVSSALASCERVHETLLAGYEALIYRGAESHHRTLAIKDAVCDHMVLDPPRVGCVSERSSLAPWRLGVLVMLMGPL